MKYVSVCIVICTSLFLFPPKVCKYSWSAALHFKFPYPHEEKLKALILTWIAACILLLRQNHLVSVVRSLWAQSKQKKKISAYELTVLWFWCLLGDQDLTEFSLCNDFVITLFFIFLIWKFINVVAGKSQTKCMGKASKKCQNVA